MEKNQRVTWSKWRDTILGFPEQFYWIADRTAEGWEFWERNAWEERWFAVVSTRELLRRANAELAASQRLASGGGRR
jgi:hypothetical protein